MVLWREDVVVCHSGSSEISSRWKMWPDTNVRTVTAAPSPAAICSLAHRYADVAVLVCSVVLSCGSISSSGEEQKP